jgi:hypothetical protein
MKSFKQYLTEMQAPVPTQGTGTNPNNIPIPDPRLVDPKSIKPFDGTPPDVRHKPLEYKDFPRNPPPGTVVFDIYGGMWIWDGESWYEHHGDRQFTYDKDGNIVDVPYTHERPPDPDEYFRYFKSPNE